jgi:hypothetical protein
VAVKVIAEKLSEDPKDLVRLMDIPRGDAK